MKVAIIASNYLSLKKTTKKGTEIIVHTFINSLVKQKSLQITTFASGDSDLPTKIESIDYYPSTANEHIIKAGKHIIFELALLSKAFSQQDKFDLYHINIGDGDIALPFAPFVKKPILITLYHPTDIQYAKKYFSLFEENKNVYFVSPTNIQRKRLPYLPYIATIYHGIDAYHSFIFNPQGGTNMMWAGRAIPQKGMDIVIEIARLTKQNLKLFGITKSEHKLWFNDILQKIDQVNLSTSISIALNKNRHELIKHFQTSKLFLFPVQWEEPFGLVMTESMACGTPVIAYGRGSIPEIIKDGETGFIVNPSDDDIRGNWIIKKTGINGLREAVNRIYAMPKNEYLQMRRLCRKHVEENFTVEKMVDEYKKVYKEILKESLMAS
ncbi:MAG: glycosyltransferase [Candidatus Levyibacteriota bacterium]|nr:MAG: glycosyltransferase [Candidatus Levybacteria bacterium]